MSLSELIKRKDIKLNLLNPITLEHDLKQLATATKSIAAIYMACGIDITKASVFVQSHGRVDVATKFCHTNCSVNRMIQFKEKSCKAVRCWRCAEVEGMEGWRPACRGMVECRRKMRWHHNVKSLERKKKLGLHGRKEQSLGMKKMLGSVDAKNMD
ncbi:hypothetical protein NE237_005548 [Protea cynaroides]|uniref:Uncharacterized protein n=1 Tax=Protea cynaroides TaxID=273540 RepID=A0A9Q0JSZ9_9MAGN|nr:hypothetical protein NE237_005548 [Protea cynaroides]